MTERKENGDGPKPLPSLDPSAVDALFGGMRTDSSKALGKIEKPEAQRLQDALDEAVRIGIVRVEDFPCPTGSNRTANLISRAHFSIAQYDTGAIQESVYGSEIEQYQLLHLLRMNGVTTPVFHEGRMHGVKYVDMDMENDPPMVTIEGKQVCAWTPEAQQYLFDHPDELKELFKREIVKSGKRGDYVFTSSNLTLFEHIDGAHSKKTDPIIKGFGEEWCKWKEGFDAKYLEFRRSLVVKDGKVNLSMNLHRDNTLGLVSNAPVDAAIIRLNDVWYTAAELAADTEAYCKYLDELHEINVLRDEELTALHLSTPAGGQSLSSTGISHTQPVLEALKHQVNVRVITPAASIQHDIHRNCIPCNDPKSTTYNVDIFQKIHAIAVALRDGQPLPDFAQE